MPSPDTEAARIGQDILDRNPGLARPLTQFMTLYDAAEVLTELKPPQHETATAYLRGIADHLLRDAGIPEQFLAAMIEARPPLV